MSTNNKGLKAVDQRILDSDQAKTLMKILQNIRETKALAGLDTQKGNGTKTLTPYVNAPSVSAGYQWNQDL